MKPTNELRWVRRMEHVPIEDRPEFCMHTSVKVLQQKWYCTMSYCEEWRDVPTVEGEGDKESK